MITPEQLKELRKRMLKHKVKDDKAVVELSAKELQELLDYISELELDLKDWQSNYSRI